MEFVGSELERSEFDKEQNRCKAFCEVSIVEYLLVITFVHNTMKLQKLTSVTIKLSSHPLI